MRLFRFCCFLLGIFFLSEGYSQDLKFSRDSVKFIKEAEAYLAQLNKPDAKKFFKEFEIVWFGGKFDAEQRAQVYNACDLIVEKKLKPYPDFKNYLVAVQKFVSSGKTAQDFNEWHATLDKVMESRKKEPISSYIETSKELFADNIIFESTSTVWKSTNNHYRFVYDKEPIIVFKSLNLKCYSKGDSSTIYHTIGKYYPNTSTWVGEGGRMTWERAGLDTTKVYADIKHYEFSMKSAGFVADSVSFTSRYFDHPILGKLNEKVLSNRGSEKVQYPSFESYDQRLAIPEIFKDVDYEGGFTIRGQNLMGTGSIGNLAKLKIKYEDKNFLFAESIGFTINDKEITSERASVKFVIGDDTISHPGLDFKYTNADRQLLLVRGGVGIAMSPFFNNYHKLDMKPEAMYWRLGDPVIRFGALFGSTDSTAIFESFNYFDKELYGRLEGFGANPIIYIKAHAMKMKADVFDVVELATTMRMSVNDVEPTLFELAALGFIDYDHDRRIVTVKEKVYNYIDARKGTRDFDAIRIQSDAKVNATLNLLSKELDVKGVRKTDLSEAQMVKIYPTNRRIIIKANRDMEFAGAINAGRTVFYGSQFKFSYDNFKLDLIDCDSMRLRAVAPDGRRQVWLTSKIEDVRGYVEIDGPNNKSGKDTSLNNYPIFTCTKKTYVYYDDPSIQKGAYPRDNFKFIIEPFKMDSLDNFTNAGIAFDGEFLSAGIFPSMNETLRMQKDYSLGFIRQTPKGGYGIYGEKANYDNEIRLSNKGLQGSGEISFITSLAKSNEITFFIDSLTAIAQHYENSPQEKDPEVPHVIGKDCYVAYIPGDKVLFASSLKKDLEFFKDQEAKLDGRLALRPDGMTGLGKMYFGNGQLLSYSYKYEIDAINADTAEFSLMTVDLDGMAFKTEDVNAHVDFTDRKGEFKSNSGESFVQFPENQYICYMDQFNWFMDNDDLEMESKDADVDVTIDSDLDLAGSNFFSVHPKQDSLNFRSPKALYNVRKKRIDCNKIVYVTVADARIFPDSGHMVIRRNAKIETLQKSKILANYITKYHDIFDATIDIFGRRSYEAKGYYNYVDGEKNQQKIYFNNIKPDTTYQTTANGEIKTEDGFRLSAQFEFHGKVAMFASVNELTFTGETQINHNCEGYERNWMSFTGQIDPEDIFIPVKSEMTDISGKPIGAGIVLNNDSLSMYSTFLSRKLSKNHPNVMTADGFIHYNREKNIYEISNREKMVERSLPGNFVALDLENCRMEGDGKINFGQETGQLEMNPIGEIKYNPHKDELEMKTSLILNFPFNDDAWEKMSKHILEYPNLSAVDIENSTYEKSLREFVGLEAADKVISDLTIHGKVKGKNFDDKLDVSLYIADIRFKWDPVEKMYRSYGRIGIANIKKKQVYKYVNGEIRIRKKRSADEVDIYLELGENNYYYFNYKKTILSTYSSNEEYNTAITETKKDKTKFNGKKGVDDFSFMIGSQSKAAAFKRLSEMD